MTIKFNLLLTICLISHLSFSQDITQKKEKVTAIFNVNILPMDTNLILRNQTVLIKDGKILQIEDAANIRADGDFRLINGKGKYLVPGLAEMHAHIPVPNEADSSIVEETLFLYLSNGITTIRGMLGQPYHLQLKERVAKDEVLGPRIYTSSPSLNGHSITSIEEARDKVRQYQQEGYDFLKIHPGLTLANFREVIKTADAVGIRFAGHIPTAVGIERAIKAKYASVDHLDGFLEGTVPKSAKVDKDANGFFGFNFTELIDESNLPNLINMAMEANVWVVPTQSLMVHLTSEEDVNEMGNRPELQYVSSKMRFQWKSARNQLQQDSSFTFERARKFMNFRNLLLKKMQVNGVGVLLGSDAPQIFNVPGFSIQHEMRAMAAAGLSPFEILQAGTTNPARFFQEIGQYGVIKEGASADLILLAANPLEKIENMEKIEGVMLRGEWLDKRFIDNKLAEIAKKYE